MKKTTSYILILVFLCLVIGVPTLWWQKYKSFNEQNIKIKEKKLELKNKEDYYSYLKDIDSKIKEKEEILFKIDNILPEKIDLEKIINFLDKKSSQSGLILQQITAEKPVVLDKNYKITKNIFSLSLTGTYDSLKNFLSFLQKSSRFPNVELIKFNKSRDENVFSIELKASFYSY